MARTLEQILASEKPEVVAEAQKAATEMLRETLVTGEESMQKKKLG